MFKGEVWEKKIVTMLVKVVNLANEHERLQWREKLGEVLSEKTLYVSEVGLGQQFILSTCPAILF